MVGVRIKSTKYYQFGNPIKFAFRKHLCFCCGENLEIRKHSKVVNSNSPEAKYYDFTYGESNHIKGDCNFIHKIFYCPKCEKEIEPVTQLSYEDNEKWVSKAYNKLLKHFNPQQISKIWIDNEGNILYSEPNIEKLQKVLFLVTTDKKEIKISCSITGRKKYWERPVYIQKDKCFNKTLSNLIKETEVKNK